MKFNFCHFIGCGGTGSFLATPLTQLLSYHPNGCNSFRFYDGDNYEEKNAIRQIFPQVDIGKNKAAVTALTVASSVPGASISYSDSYVDKDTMVESLIQYNRKGELQLIVVAVDSESARKDIIDAADQCQKEEGINFAMVLPGNEYDTAMCLWYCGYEGEIYKTHPFDNAINWKEPSDRNVDHCQTAAVSSPQLITANFAAAFMSLMTTEKLLNDHDLPYKLSYSGVSMSIITEGRFKKHEAQEPTSNL